MTSIANDAFRSCSGLTSISVEEGNAKYDSRNNCNAIIETATNTLIAGCKNTVIPNSVTNIEEYAFNGCSGLTSVNIPNSVTNIGYHAFYGCSGLTSVIIPSSVTSIGDETFAWCFSLTSVTIPNSVTNIEHGAFLGCSSLTSITIPNSVTSIGWEVFEGCSSLTSITIPNSVTSIGSGAFYGCERLTSITIPNSVTEIKNDAFYGCKRLTSVTIPTSVTNIGAQAFYECSNLTSITIPNSVVEIGNDAFYGTKWYKNLPDGMVYVGNILYRYKGIMPSDTKIEIKDGTKYITDGAFSGCSNLISVTIPNSVTRIGYSTFKNCSNLTSVTIPNSVTSIGGYAFSWCSSLTSINIPNSVTEIGFSAFLNCSNLISITIPSSVESIRSSAFYNTKWYKNLPDGMVYVGNILYGYKGNMPSNTRIEIKDGTKYITDGAFSDCSNLISVTIPNSITSIGERVFRNCSNLTSITVEKGNTNYDSRDDCNAIIETATNTLIVGCKNTAIPNSVTNIGEDAFSGCSGLTSITIPNSVTSIGEDAFFGCSGLTSITISKSVTNIGNYAFSGCYSLTSVTNLSTTPPNIDYYTFYKYGTLHVLPGCKSTYEKTNYWKYFTIVEDAIDPFAPIELADGKTYNGTTTQENKEINYTRTFNNTSWQALYIPFSMTYDDWKDDLEIAFINSIRQYDNDEDGIIDETIMDVVKVKNGSLIPNTPYLIKAKSTGEKTISVNNATLYKAEENSIECSTMLAKYTFTGTYSTIPAATLLANNYYAMGGGSLIMTDGTSDLKPFRWYLNVESRSPMYNVSSGAKAITINVVGEEEATGISQMSSDREHSSAIYDLNGRKMSQKTLKSGLYIKNGKKVFIK